MSWTSLDVVCISHVAFGRQRKACMANETTPVYQIMKRKTIAPIKEIAHEWAVGFVWINSQAASVRQRIACMVNETTPVYEIISQDTDSFNGRVSVGNRPFVTHDPAVISAFPIIVICVIPAFWICLHEAKYPIKRRSTAGFSLNILLCFESFTRRPIPLMSLSHPSARQITE